MENSLSCEWAENNNGSSSSSCYPSNYCYSSFVGGGLLSWPPPPPFEDDEDEEMMVGCGGGGGGGSKTASKSHSQAEKRRRDRINAQLAALRKLIPMSHKMDKAALLSSAVDHVKELKIKVAETRKLLADIPADTDEVVVHGGDGDHQPKDSPIAAVNILRASICCDDRPGLFAEINSALKELRLTTVHAEVSCLGGRVKSVFLLLCPEGEEGICVDSVKQSLKVALSKVAIPCSANSYRIKSKRQRFFLPSPHYYQ